MTGTGRRAALLILAAASALSGCADERVPTAEPPPVATASASTPPVEVTPAPTPPPLPAAAKAATRAGASAFFTHFWELYDFAYLTGDPGPLQAISADECVFCQSATTNARKVAMNDWVTIGGDVTVIDIVSAPGDPATGIVVNSLIRQSERVITSATGDELGRTPGLDNERIDALVTFTSGAWEVTTVDIVAKDGQP